MNVIYLKNTSYIADCVAMLNKHVMHENYASLLRQDALHSAQEKVLYEQLYQVLSPLLEAIGAYFDVHFSNYRNLFEPLRNGMISPAKQIMNDIDPTCDDISIVFEELKKQANEDSNFILRKLIQEDNDRITVLDLSEKELLERLDEFTIQDQLKWKLLQMNMHSAEVLVAFQEILEALYPIYQTYEDQVRSFLHVYEQDIKKAYSQGDMVQYFLDKKHIRYDMEGKNIYVLPSVIQYGTLWMTDIESYPDRVYVGWGICLLQGNVNQEAMFDTEQLCTSLKLLSDKSKFEILKIISNERLYGTQIAKKLNLTTPTISYHLQSLLNAGFLLVEKEERRVYYRLNDEYVEQFFHSVKQALKGQS